MWLMPVFCGDKYFFNPGSPQLSDRHMITKLGGRRQTGG